MRIPIAIAAGIACLAAAACGGDSPSKPTPTPGAATSPTPPVPTPTRASDLLTPPAAGSPAPTATLAPGQPREAWRHELGEGWYALPASDGYTAVIAAGTRVGDRFSGAVVTLDLLTGKPMWRKELPCAPFEPVLWADLAIVPCSDGGIYALARGDGAGRWTVSTGAAPFHMAVVETVGVLVIDDADPETYGLDNVDIAAYPHGVVRAYQARTGTPLWETTFAQEFTYIGVDSDRLLVATGSNTGAVPPGVLARLDPMTGQRLWETGDVGPSNSPPVVYGTTAITAASVVRGHDIATGATKWTNRRAYAGTLVAGSGVPSRYIANDGYGGNALFAIDPDTGADAWAAPYCDCPFYPGATIGIALIGGPGLMAVDALTGKVKWAIRVGDYGTLRPATGGATILVGSRGSGTVLALR